MNAHRCQLVVKRLMDVSVAAGLLLLLAPLLACVGLLVRWQMGPPILFRHRRPGKHGRPFTLHKFRTMTDARNPDGTTRPDGDRLTPLGRFLRRASLDELPQLWNVLRGDMSLVGPRPLLMQYLDRYTAEQARRLNVKPGITGWAQINGRNAISSEEKFVFDVWYVDHWSLWLDLRILVLTVVRVFKREGISAADHCTMPEFMGPASSRKDAA
jgi:sugar transferase EpsL